MRIARLARSDESAFASDVQVSGVRRLRVDEIIARHQAARAGQNASVRSVVADGSTTLTFQVPGFAAPFTVTAATRVFAAAGETTVQHTRIQVNGLDIAASADDVPRLPLLEPERVSTPPLTIGLTEAYRYELRGRDRVAGRDAYVVAFDPRIADRSLFAGLAWIDTATFGIMKTDAAQTMLRGPIASSRQVDEFERIDVGATPAWLIRRSEIFQVYAGPRESTPIHRVMTFDRTEVNRADYDAELSAAMRSNAVMLRDTPGGYRFLAPGSIRSGWRRASRLVVQGRADDDGRRRRAVRSEYLGPAGVRRRQLHRFQPVQHRRAGECVFRRHLRSLFMVDAAVARRVALTGDGSAVALSYNDRAFRDGIEHYDENIRHDRRRYRSRCSAPWRRRCGFAPATSSLTRGTGAPRLRRRTSSSQPALRSHACCDRNRTRTVERRSAGCRRSTSGVEAGGGRPQRPRRGQRASASIGSARRSRDRSCGPRAPSGASRRRRSRGRHLDCFSRFAFGTFDNPLRGYPSVSVRYDSGIALRSAATWTPASTSASTRSADLGIVRAPEDDIPRGFPASALRWRRRRRSAGSLGRMGLRRKGITSDGTTGTHVIRVSRLQVF